MMLVKSFYLNSCCYILQWEKSQDKHYIEMRRPDKNGEWITFLLFVYQDFFVFVSQKIEN